MASQIMSFLLDSYLLSLIGDGLPANESVNVYLCADEVPTSEDSLELFTLGATGNMIQGGVTLQITSETAGPIQQMNLFCQAPDSMLVTSVMNAFVRGGMHESGGTVPLHLKNTQQILESGATLVIKGEGETAGALTADDSMNLFLMRDPNETISLFIAGQADLDGGVDLVLNSLYSTEEGMELVIPGVVDVKTSSQKLFIHGF